MKKFVVLMLVLCLATSANATLRLTVNGGPNPGQITLAPSDWIELDVEAMPGFIGGQFSIQLSNSQGLLDASGIQFDQEWISLLMTDIVTLYDPYDLPFKFPTAFPPEPHQVTVEGGNISQVSGPILFEEMLLWDLMFHCEEATDVEVMLYSDGLFTDGGFIDPGVLLDSLYIVQPEPMTIALLGLGGLFLRRRK